MLNIFVTDFGSYYDILFYVCNFSQDYGYGHEESHSKCCIINEQKCKKCQNNSFLNFFLAHSNICYRIMLHMKFTKIMICYESN